MSYAYKMNHLSVSPPTLSYLIQNTIDVGSTNNMTHQKMKDKCKIHLITDIMINALITRKQYDCFGGSLV